MADPIVISLPTYRPTGTPFHDSEDDWSTAPTIAGSGGIWGDDTDDTYYEWTGQEVGYYPYILPNVVMASFPAIDVAGYNPDDWPYSLYIPSDGLRVRLKSNGGGTVFVYLREYDGSPITPYTGLLRYNNLVAPSSTVTTVTPTVLTDNMGDIAYYAQLDTLHILLSYEADLPYFVTVYDVWIEDAILVLYPPDGPALAPPLRQYPRDDGLGASPGLRQWPPPRSVQRSNRRAGSTYP